MEETKKQEQTTTHKIGIYLWIWGLLFFLSFCSYMVDWFHIYVFKSRINYGFLYAFILGTLCTS